MEMEMEMRMQIRYSLRMQIEVEPEQSRVDHINLVASKQTQLAALELTFAS